MAPTPTHLSNLSPEGLRIFENCQTITKTLKNTTLDQEDANRMAEVSKAIEQEINNYFTTNSTFPTKNGLIDHLLTSKTTERYFTPSDPDKRKYLQEGAKAHLSEVLDKSFKTYEKAKKPSLRKIAFGILKIIATVAVVAAAAVGIAYAATTMPVLIPPLAIAAVGGVISGALEEMGEKLVKKRVRESGKDIKENVLGFYHKWKGLGTVGGLAKTTQDAAKLAAFAIHETARNTLTQGAVPTTTQDKDKGKGRT
jgi:hypothetical protein